MTLGIVAVTYGHSPYILEMFLCSLVRQTSRDWKLILLHDGNVMDEDVIAATSAINTRAIVNKYIERGFPIEYIETDKRYNDFGHTLREIGLKKIDTPYMCFTNVDNIYTPMFVELMLTHTQNGHIDIVHCDMLHNYAVGGVPYLVLESRLVINHIDMANFIIRTEWAKITGFTDRCFAADGLFIERFKRRFPAFKQKKLNNVLLCHC